MTKVIPPAPSLIAQVKEPIVDETGRMTLEFRQMLQDLAVQSPSRLAEAVDRAIAESLKPLYDEINKLKQKGESP